MSLLNLRPDEPAKKHSKNRLIKILGIGGIIGAVALGSTLASNISLNGDQNVEFGQGVATTTACSGNDSITVTPVSTFINEVGAGDFYFTSVSVSNIPSQCIGVNFKISAYGDSDNALRLTECSNVGTTPVINFTGDSGTDHTVNSDEDMFTIITEKTETGFTVSWVNPQGCTSSARAADVKRVTLESNSMGDGSDWNLVKWTGTTQNGPSRYANSLVSGKPTWITEGSLPEFDGGFDFSYNFSSKGMGFSGNSEGFPYVTSFSIPSTEKVSIQFNFLYNNSCSDQGVILFPAGTTPDWSWADYFSGLFAGWNCGDPQLGAQSSREMSMNEPLQIGNAYLAIFTYDPSLGSDNMSLRTKSLGGQTLDQIFLTATLPTGEDYKVGFSADLDFYEDGETRSYFKNLIIAIG